CACGNSSTTSPARLEHPTAVCSTTPYPAQAEQESCEPALSSEDPQACRRSGEHPRADTPAGAPLPPGKASGTTQPELNVISRGGGKMRRAQARPPERDSVSIAPTS